MYSDVSDREILRYMRYGTDDVPQGLLDDINRLKKNFFDSASPRHVYACCSIYETTQGLCVVSTDITLTGRDIQSFLKGSDECVLLAATLGIGADRAIARARTVSAGDGLIMDAIANAAIELYCDNIQYTISGKASKRYSCGYGDLPVELQPRFLMALDAQRAIGIYCNSSCMMIPAKSVTAIIASGGEAAHGHGCRECEMQKNCKYRKDGDLCGR